MVDYKEATVLSTTDEQITLMQWLQKLTKTFGNAVITNMSLSNDGDKSLTFTFTLADGSTKTATATAITMTEDEKALIGELVKTVTASSDGVTFNKAVTIVGNVSYQGNGIHQGTESFLGATSFADAPTCKTTATASNQLITKAYVDEANEKCYQALKTVTKDFTRTDPVYVRIGDDGEPEIHYTITSSNANQVFESLDLGESTLYVHNGKIITAAENIFASTMCKRVYLDSIGSEARFFGFNMCGYAQGLKSIVEFGAFDTSKITSLTSAFAWNMRLKIIPAWDFSNVTVFKNAFYMCISLSEFHAYGMKSSFSLSNSYDLAHDAILEVFNNLGSVSKDDNITLTLGSEKLALMSDDEKLIATEKGWYLA